MVKKSQHPIIIKKIKKGGDHGHHGGAWKIAYADFVTAMMAFFLLMWLLNATSEEQRRGIANYFDPFAAEAKGGGNMGVMGGTSVKEDEGSLDDKSNRIALKPTPLTEKGAGGNGAGVAHKQDADAQDTGGMTEEEKENIKAKQDIQDKLIKQDPQPTNYKSKAEEEKALHSVSNNIKKIMEQNSELKKLGDHIHMQMTPEGLRISIVDQIKTAMFPSGSSRMYKQMEDILKTVAAAIKDVPNAINVEGHTDGSQYTSNSLFSNWELSSERANASRRILEQNKVDSNRFQSVIGKADRELLDKRFPKNPQNRRISITLLRDFKEPTAEPAADKKN